MIISPARSNKRASKHQTEKPEVIEPTTISDVLRIEKGCHSRV